MNFIDTHSHLFLEEFSEDLEQVIERAKAVGITGIFMPNIDTSTVTPMSEVASKYKDYCFPMIGLHPTSVNQSFGHELQLMKLLLDKENNFVAIGEVGMDLYWDASYLTEQRNAFETQIEWSIEYDLPLVIHSRDSFEEIYAIMKKYPKNAISGIFHSFTGNSEQALQLLEFERFKLGINGIVTFKKSNLPDVLKDIPVDKIVLETDSPYLAPAPNRGKRNESANLIYTLQKVAEIYRISTEELAEITTKNALKVFKRK